MQEWRNVIRDCLLDEKSNDAKAPLFEEKAPDEGSCAHAKGPNAEGKVEGHLLLRAVVFRSVLQRTEVVAIGNR